MGGRFSDGELRFLQRMRVARLATTDGAGQPHVVPIVFATDGENVYSPIDRKPKRVEPAELKRVRNLTLNPQVALVVDEYDEDWSRLAWVLITGSAEIVGDGPLHDAGTRLLREKYPQYDAMPLDSAPIIVVTPVRVTRWGRLFDPDEFHDGA